MTLIHLPTTGYKITCPPTILPQKEWNNITLVGEAAGSTEVNWWSCDKCKHGVPYPGNCQSCGIPRQFKPQGFVGASGNMLAMICRNAGIDFKKCNRSNVVKTWPGEGKDFGIYYYDPKNARSQRKSCNGGDNSSSPSYHATDLMWL